MSEHPLYRMWLERLEAEIAREKARTLRGAARELDEAAWQEAWRAYKTRALQEYIPAPRPRWWICRDGRFCS